MLASNRIDFPPSHCFCHPFSRCCETQLEPSGELDSLACVQGTMGARFDRCTQPVRPASVRMSTKDMALLFPLPPRQTPEWHRTVANLGLGRQVSLLEETRI